MIELVIAIAIVGLALTFALPRLMDWADRLAFSARQQQFEDALAELGNKARRAGHSVVLRSTGSGQAPTEEPPIELPAGWTLAVEPPIAFRYDGICTGGTVRLRYPAGERSYRLLAPYCLIEAL